MKQIKDYELACNALVEVFCRKQEMECDGWVNGDIGGIADFGDYCFSMHDIVLDLRTKQRDGTILEWYRDNVNFSREGINYQSYIRGLRVSML